MPQPSPRSDGLYAGRQVDDRAIAVAALLSAAGLPAEAVADIASMVWGKLLVNAAINPVAALAGVLNGALVRLAERHNVKVPANRAVATLIRQVSASHN